MNGTQLSQISLDAQGQAGTTYYGLVWLALATVAYTDEASKDIANVGTDLPINVRGLPDLPAPPSHAQPAPGTWGKWQVDWGPVVTADNSNLMYVASYREVATGSPVFAAVVIRGTDTAEHYTRGVKPGGLILQILEDLDVDNKVAWSNVLQAPSKPCQAGAAASDVAIARGTCVGLKLLRNFQAPATLSAPMTRVDVQTYVQWLAQTYPGLPIIVTGHSLGGCLATVMAAYLADTLNEAKPNIVPHPFAPPTAGTQAFADKFSAQFPNAKIWWNTLDIVPNAFQNVANASSDTPSLTNILGFWKEYGGPSIDALERTSVEVFVRTLHAYAQPSANLQTLKGSVVVPSADCNCKNDWATQLEIQHFPPCYHYLISTQVSGVAAYSLPIVSANPNPCFAVPPAKCK